MENLISKDVNPHSLKLNVDNPFLAYPMSSDNQDRKIFTKVTATVRNVSGQPLPGVQVFVSDESLNNLQKVKIYASDQETEIKLQLENGVEGFFVNTDKHGNLLFFIYPLKSEALIIRLFSQIPGSAEQTPANYIIYIVNNTLQDMKQEFVGPEILNFLDGPLISKAKSKFLVKVEKYDGALSGDTILFFVNGNYTEQSIQISSENDLDSYFPLPYAIFPKDQMSDFFYIVIRKLGDLVFSKSRILSLTYKGNEYNEPWTDVDRIYESCKVYSSYGVFDDSLIEQYDLISNNTISKYLENPNHEGLFIQIIGTNDPNDTKKAPLGSQVTLNLYINSKTEIVTKSYTKTMSNFPDIQGNNTATLTFGISHEVLKYKEAYIDKSAKIFFDYQIGSDNNLDVTYGKIWQGYIDTNLDSFI
ncbi:hypothetical protein [Xenorhabdus bovienii]|uniref:hypothetical protein n=1 Tax=Xenorhabdus bovienii TaxID=40576 RepID=UPI003DA30441